MRPNRKRRSEPRAYRNSLRKGQARAPKSALTFAELIEQALHVTFVLVPQGKLEWWCHHQSTAHPRIKMARHPLCRARAFWCEIIMCWWYGRTVAV